MHESLQKLAFPVVAFARDGWEKVAENIDELTEAACDGDVSEFFDMKICDSAGRLYVVKKAWRAWPKSKLGALLCRLATNCTRADFRLSEPVPISLEELKQRVWVQYPHWPECDEARNHRELIEMLL